MESNRKDIGRREEVHPDEVFVSLFSGYSNSRPIGKVQLSDFLLQPTYKEQVEAIRAISDKAKRRKLKSRLPAVTPSGIFSERCNTGLISHSGFICIDIDGKDNPGVTDWEALKPSVSGLPGLWYAGLSVSGNGLCLVFRIAYPGKHLEHFNALKKEIKQSGLVVDAACKEVSRLRGVSYDPLPYYNPDADAHKIVIGHIKNPEQGGADSILGNNCILVSPARKSNGSYNTSSESDRTISRVNCLVAQIDRTGSNIADYYPHWYAIGRALASEFREAGRSYFHAVSCQSSKYSPVECDRQYDACLRTCHNTSISTFFWHCRQYGLTATREDYSGFP